MQKLQKPQKHNLDRWQQWSKETIEKNTNNKKDNCNAQFIDTKKGR